MTKDDINKAAYNKYAAYYIDSGRQLAFVEGAAYLINELHNMAHNSNIEKVVDELYEQFYSKYVIRNQKTIKDINIKIQLGGVYVTVNNIPLKICTNEFKAKVNEILTNIINFNKV